MPSGVENETSY